MVCTGEAGELESRDKGLRFGCSGRITINIYHIRTCIYRQQIAGRSSLRESPQHIVKWYKCVLAPFVCHEYTYTCTVHVHVCAHEILINGHIQ